MKVDHGIKTTTTAEYWLSLAILCYPFDILKSHRSKKAMIPNILHRSHRAIPAKCRRNFLAGSHASPVIISLAEATVGTDGHGTGRQGHRPWRRHVDAWTENLATKRYVAESRSSVEGSSARKRPGRAELHAGCVSFETALVESPQDDGRWCLPGWPWRLEHLEAPMQRNARQLVFCRRMRNGGRYWD